MKRTLPQQSYPHSEDSEKGLIGSLLQVPQKVLELVAQKRFQPEWIYSEQYKNLLLLAQEMLKEGKPVDLITISQEAADKWPESEVNYAVAATDCYSFVPTAGNASYYMEKIQEKAAKRLAMQECERMYSEFGNGSSLQDVHDLITGGFVKVKEACAKPEVGNHDVDELHGFLDEAESAATGKVSECIIPFGFPTLDEETQGARKGELLVIHGLTSSFKSILAQTIVTTNVFRRPVDKEPRKALIFTLEMPHQQYVRRLVADLGSINLKSIKTGQYTKYEHQNFMRTFNDIEKVMKSRHLSIVDMKRCSMTESAIEARIRTFKKNHGLDICVVDLLNLMRFNSKSEKNRAQELEGAAARFKLLALELEIFMIVIAQSKDDGTIFDSKQVASSADIVLSMIPKFETVSGHKKVCGTKGIYVDKAREARRGWSMPVETKGQFARIEEGMPVVE